MNGPPKTAGSRQEAVDPKAERLAAALRENLKRRKAQARAKERSEAVPDKDSG